MCEPATLAAFFKGATDVGAATAATTGGTSAAAATATATGIAQGAITPTVIGSTVPATATGLAGAALAPAATGLPAAGGLSGIAKAAMALGPGLLAPALFKPSMPKVPAAAQSDPVNSAAKARMAARLKVQGAYGRSATNLTGGTASPTGGQKLKLGA